MTTLIFPRLQRWQLLQSGSVQCLKISNPLLVSITKQWREAKVRQPMLKITISIIAQLLHQQILSGDMFSSLLLPVIRSHGSNQVVRPVAVIGSPGCRSTLSTPSSCASLNTALVQSLQMPKGGLVQWSLCKGCLTLNYYFFLEEEGPCIKKTSSLVLCKKLSRELFVPKHSAGNTRTPLCVWDAHSTHATALNCFGTREVWARRPAKQRGSSKHMDILRRYSASATPDFSVSPPHAP